MKRNLRQWEEFINEVRSWDRLEHNWAISQKRMETTNIVTKNNFIHRMMKKYKLTKRK